MLKAYEKQSLKPLLRVVVELAWCMCGRALAVCGRGIDVIVVRAWCGRGVCVVVNRVWCGRGHASGDENLHLNVLLLNWTVYNCTISG
jgi:hypothetical protein